MLTPLSFGHQKTGAAFFLSANRHFDDETANLFFFPLGLGLGFEQAEKV
jgi:hypothetical protein